MTDGPRLRFSYARLIAPALSVGAPLALMLALNYSRPDLMGPMLDHVYGSLAVGVVSLLALVGAVATAIASLVDGESVAARVTIGLLGTLLCTVPAMVLMLFAPVVFAFMFGNV